MNLPARRLASIVPIIVVALAAWSGAPNAQTSDKSGQKDSSASGSAVDQLKAGAQRIGEGAERIGEGIKQGAVQTWEAVKTGASAAADKLNQGTSAPRQAPAPPVSVAPAPAPSPPPGDVPR